MNMQKGFSAFEGLLIVLIVGIVGFGGWYVWSHQKDDDAPVQNDDPILIEDKYSTATGDFEFKTITTQAVSGHSQQYRIRARADQNLYGLCTYVLTNGADRYEYRKKPFGSYFCDHTTSLNRLQPYGEWKLAVFYEGNDGKLAIGKKDAVNIYPDLPKEYLEIAAAFAINSDSNIRVSANLPTHSPGVCDFYLSKDRDSRVSDSARTDGSGTCTTDISRGEFSSGIWKLTVYFVSDDSYIHAQTNILAERKFTIE